MLDGALAFMKRNMRKMTIINAGTGMREDRAEYPHTAVREAVLNALCIGITACIRKESQYKSECMRIVLKLVIRAVFTGGFG